jgi:hypothetical protein
LARLVQRASLHFRNKTADRIYGDYVLTPAAAAEGLGVALLNNAFGLPQTLRESLVEIDYRPAVAPLSYHVLADASADDNVVVNCIAALHALASK